MANNKNLEFTGERLVTEIQEYWSLEHLHRYALSLEYAKDKVVLDIASGEGYGSFLLSKVAEKVTGIDISEEAILHAKSKYLAENLYFIVGSVIAIPVPDKSIDLVVSFETLEHIAEHEMMILEILRVLKPNGLLIISTPDKKYYSDLPGYKNPFHVSELYFDEFRELMRKKFKNVHFLQQKSIVGSVVVDSNLSSGKFMDYSGDFTEVSSFDGLRNPLYHICIATNSEHALENHFASAIFSNDILSRKYFDSFQKINELSGRIEILENKINLYKQQINHPVIRFLRAIRRIFK